jgi:adenylosuccinate synthase
MSTSSPKPRAWVVLDLGFGDSGKGTTVDYLVRAERAPLVVRFNGGAQAGHAVVTDDGRAHVFSQFGAGTFVQGTRTHLAQDFVLHPTALLVEARRLSKLGVSDALSRLSVNPRARVITPFHQAANRLRELARGQGRHGTCGVGFGETVRDSIDAPAEVLRAQDLCKSRDVVFGMLSAARERMWRSLNDVLALVRHDPRAQDELSLFFDRAVSDRWLDAIEPLRKTPSLLAEDTRVRDVLQHAPVVFEGAQGVLLDEHYGFHPHTTWSDCTAGGARGLLNDATREYPLETLGVLRTYLTRHGEGPMPSESAELTATRSEAHNGNAGWQGAFRVGHQDLVLMRYALRAARHVTRLVLTHADRLDARTQLVTRYENASDPRLFVHDSDGRVVDLRHADHASTEARLAHQSELGQALRGVRVVTEAAPRTKDAFIERLEADLRIPVALVSSGPKASDKRARH